MLFIIRRTILLTEFYRLMKEQVKLYHIVQRLFWKIEKWLVRGVVLLKTFINFGTNELRHTLSYDIAFTIIRFYMCLNQSCLPFEYSVSKEGNSIMRRLFISNNKIPDSEWRRWYFFGRKDFEGHNLKINPNLSYEMRNCIVTLPNNFNWFKLHGLTSRSNPSSNISVQKWQKLT